MLDHGLLFTPNQAVTKEFEGHDEYHNDYSQNLDVRARHVGLSVDHLGGRSRGRISLSLKFGWILIVFGKLARVVGFL